MRRLLCACVRAHDNCTYIWMRACVACWMLCRSATRVRLTLKRFSYARTLIPRVRLANVRILCLRPFRESLEGHRGMTRDARRQPDRILCARVCVPLFPLFIVFVRI